MSKCLREKRGGKLSLVSLSLDGVAHIIILLNYSMYITVPRHTRPYMILGGRIKWWHKLWSKTDLFISHFWPWGHKPQRVLIPRRYPYWLMLIQQEVRFQTYVRTPLAVTQYVLVHVVSWSICVLRSWPCSPCDPVSVRLSAVGSR